MTYFIINKKPRYFNGGQWSVTFLSHNIVPTSSASLWGVHNYIFYSGILNARLITKTGVKSLVL